MLIYPSAVSLSLSLSLSLSHRVTESSGRTFRNSLCSHSLNFPLLKPIHFIQTRSVACSCSRASTSSPSDLCPVYPVFYPVFYPFYPSPPVDTCRTLLFGTSGRCSLSTFNVIHNSPVLLSFRVPIHLIQTTTEPTYGGFSATVSITIITLPIVFKRIDRAFRNHTFPFHLLVRCPSSSSH
jgi:hypothetical protein